MRYSAALILILLVFSNELHAHARSESWSEWQRQENQVSAEITMSSQDLTRFLSDPASATEQELAIRIAQQFAVHDAKEPCILLSARPMLAATGYEKFLIEFSCKEQAVAAKIGLMLGSVPGHVHVARFGQDLEFEQVLTTKAADIVFDEGSQQTLLLQLFYSGFVHILMGADHLAFLLGLLLITAGLRQRVWVISGFTLGHSLSLAMASASWVQSIDARVEATIGFTVLLTGAVYLARPGGNSRSVTLTTLSGIGAASLIVITLGTASIGAFVLLAGLSLIALGYVGLESGYPSGARTASLVFLAAVFGLFHGFGFAGFLTLTGISGAALIPPVLSFNLGVEAGQLSLLAAALIVGAVAQQLFTQTRLDAAGKMIAAVLVVIGSFWFFTRSALL